MAKKELTHGHYYVNGNKGRGMKVGMWDSDKERFICIKPPKFGVYTIYEMPHEEDDAGYAIFQPIYHLY